MFREGEPVLKKVDGRPHSGSLPPDIRPAATENRTAITDSRMSVDSHFALDSRPVPAPRPKKGTSLSMESGKNIDLVSN